jgi:hypothetical protein
MFQKITQYQANFLCISAILLKIFVFKGDKVGCPTDNVSSIIIYIDPFLLFVYFLWSLFVLIDAITLYRVNTSSVENRGRYM